MGECTITCVLRNLFSYVYNTLDFEQEVTICYHGKKRYIGAFDTQEQGSIARAIAKGYLKTEEGQKPADEQITQNVKQARVAALEAVQKIRNEDDVPPNDEDNLTLLLKLDDEEACDRPKLQSSRYQSDEVRIYFDV